MNFVTKKALPRRTFLRAAGGAAALPLLDAMTPALTARTPGPPPRFGFVYIANGVIQNQWTPKTTGRAFELSPILKPLEPVRRHVNILSGLSHLQADTMGDGTGDHPRSSAVWLTGVHAYDRSRPDVEVKLATTADQIVARAIGKDTQVPSIEMNLDPPTQGACDTGDCFFNNTVSWRTPSTPNPAESHPRIVFERLFGDGGSAAQRLARIRRNGSILDSLAREAASLEKSLGAADRAKLTEYLESVREIERRIQGVETRGIQDVRLPDRPTDVPANFDEYARLMYDLQALAFQSDVTRVFTMMISRELSTRTYGHIGIPDQHHPLSHHRNDAAMITKKARIDTHHIDLLTYFLQRLEGIKEGGGPLLDHCLILYGGGMGDGNLHRHSDLPCLMAGKLGGRFETGRHLAYKLDTPMSNLLLTILRKVGVEAASFGDSTGPLEV
jgi:hypothetical protein